MYIQIFLIHITYLICYIKLRYVIHAESLPKSFQVLYIHKKKHLSKVNQWIISRKRGCFSYSTRGFRVSHGFLGLPSLKANRGSTHGSHRIFIIFQGLKRPWLKGSFLRLQHSAHWSANLPFSMGPGAVSGSLKNDFVETGKHQQAYFDGESM